MIALSLVFLVVHAINVIQTGFPPWLVTTATSINRLIFVFGADLAIRVLLAERRVSWVLHHPIDVASVLVPPLRPLRLLTAFGAGQSLLARQGGFRRTGQAVVSSAGMLMIVGIAVLGAVTATVAAWFVEMAGSGHRTAEDAATTDLPAAVATAQQELDDSPAALLDTDKLSLLGALHRAGVLTDEEVATAVARLDRP